MEHTFGSNSVPSGLMNKSVVLTVKPLRSLAPIFPSQSDASAPPSSQFASAPPTASGNGDIGPSRRSSRGRTVVDDDDEDSQSDGYDNSNDKLRATRRRITSTTAIPVSNSEVVIDSLLSKDEERLAVSIVSSGGYEDEGDDGDVLIYSGQGGQQMDQQLVRGNLALEKSLHRANEVRVIQGLRDFANPTGKVYVYDGLYKIHESWIDKGKSGCNVFKYKLVRVAGQPEAFTLWKSIQQWKDGVTTRDGVILPDLISGAESLPVALVNDVDGEKGPAYFTYIPNLKNRVSQAGLKMRLGVFKTKNKGWGLRSWDPIRVGSFICEYAGLVIAENGIDSDNNYIFDSTRAFESLETQPSDELVKFPFPLIISSRNEGNSLELDHLLTKFFDRLKEKKDQKIVASTARKKKKQSDQSRSARPRKKKAVRQISRTSLTVEERGKPRGDQQRLAADSGSLWLCHGSNKAADMKKTEELDTNSSKWGRNESFGSSLELDHLLTKFFDRLKEKKDQKIVASTARKKKKQSDQSRSARPRKKKAVRQISRTSLTVEERGKPRGDQQRLAADSGSLWLCHGSNKAADMKKTEELDTNSSKWGRNESFGSSLELDHLLTKFFDRLKEKKDQKIVASTARKKKKQSDQSRSARPRKKKAVRQISRTSLTVEERGKPRGDQQRLAADSGSLWLCHGSNKAADMKKTEELDTNSSKWGRNESFGSRKDQKIVASTARKKKKQSDQSRSARPRKKKAVRQISRTSLTVEERGKPRGDQQRLAADSGSLWLCHGSNKAADMKKTEELDTNSSKWGRNESFGSTLVMQPRFPNKPFQRALVSYFDVHLDGKRVHFGFEIQKPG
ncbi:hypothetical protein L1987_64190 [Smallanthus sonchifolius]|uniref:Uncharacterized protein n=1 Tax=Smallanthus sonchifolius TaxID=185202 RepID=A0ACB9CFA5_9ASTR|nr:hypothetical protein L1987_64190 [Smallanthus sonchifolius]